MDRNSFDQEIYEIIRDIPSGHVATYRQIARLAGYPNYARMVGRTLSHASESLELPCHRVVNSQGRPAPGWTEQKRLLEKEGILFKKNGCVNMKLHLWIPETFPE